MQRMRTRENDQERPPQRARSVLPRALSAVAALVRWLLLSLCLSVLLEWAGMIWWWPEQGTQHSRAMLDAEIEYLNVTLSRSLFSDRPGEWVLMVANKADAMLFTTTGLRAAFNRWQRLINGYSAPQDQSSQLLGFLAGYGLAAMNIVQIVAARLAVLCLGVPLFVLSALLGLVDGLVQRDLRRWGGGRESSFLYHYAKRSNGAFLIVAGMLYLTLPVSLPPALIILPTAILFGVSIRLTASMFKKYL